MRIPNPYRWHPHTKVTSIMDGQEVVSVQGAGEWLEVPEGSLEARIDAIDKGRSDGEVLQTKMWGREMGGVMDVKDFMAKKKLEAEMKKMEEAKKAAKKPEPKAKKEAPPRIVKED